MGRGMFSPLKSTFITNTCPFFCSLSLEPPLARYGQVTSYSLSPFSALPTSWLWISAALSKWNKKKNPQNLLVSSPKSKVWVRSLVNPLPRVIPASHKGKRTEKRWDGEVFLEISHAAHEWLGCCCALGLLSTPNRNKSSIITQHSVGFYIE